MPRPKRTPHGSFIDLGLFDVPGFGGGRHVRAFAPHGHRHDRPRPVLVLFDGQNVFGDEGSFAGGWHAHEALDRFAVLKKPVAPVILAVDHGGAQRIDELTPFADGGKGGRAEAFCGWIAHALLPLARRSLALRDDPGSTVIGGSSLGGLAAFYCHFRYPEVFGGALCMSPSFWFGRRTILEWAEHQPIPWTSRVYIDCGQREGRGMMMQQAKRMSDLLAQRGYGADRLMWRPDARGTHSERAWRRRLPKALRFFFR
jgi:enterochelin esterase-like enzyme